MQQALSPGPRCCRPDRRPGPHRCRGGAFYLTALPVNLNTTKSQNVTVRTPPRFIVFQSLQTRWPLRQERGGKAAAMGAAPTGAAPRAGESPGGREGGRGQGTGGGLSPSPEAGRGSWVDVSRVTQGQGRAGPGMGMAAPARRGTAERQRRCQHAGGGRGRAGSTCSRLELPAGTGNQGGNEGQLPAGWPLASPRRELHLFLPRTWWASSSSAWFLRPRWTLSTTTARSWSSTWRAFMPPTPPSPTCTASGARWKVRAAGRGERGFVFPLNRGCCG